MTIRFARILGIAALGMPCLFWQAAGAAELGVYAGISYASVDNKVEQADFDAVSLAILDGQGFTPASGNISFDHEGPGYSFVVGYRLFPWLALEGGYLDLGKVRHFISADGDQGGPAHADLSTTTKSSGIAVAALGILPLSYRWEVYGRAGVLFATNRLNLFLSDNLGQAAANVSHNKTNLLAGAGISMSIAEIYGLRLEYQRIFDVESTRASKGDVDFLSIGVTVQF